MTGAPGTAPVPARSTTTIVAVVSLLALAWLAPATFDADSVTSIDTVLKLAQATEVSESGFRSMALPYRARALDSEEVFYPFEAPFVFLSAGRWQSIFSSFYAVIAAVALRFGVEALVVLAMAGATAAVVSTLWLPGARAAGALLLLAGTPLWLYGVTPNETALALGCLMAALAVAARVGGRRGDWTSGVLLGIAALLRDESLLVGPGLLYARTLAGRRWRDLSHVLGGVAVPLALMAIVDQWWFERPMLAHLRHAVPGFDALLPRARARLPELPAMAWRERVQTVVDYWLFGVGLEAATAGTLCVAVAHLGRRLAPAAIAVMVATAAILHAIDIFRLIAEPRITAGLFRLSPFLLLALLPRAAGERASPLMRLTWVTAGCCLGIALLTVNTEGGKPTGPRLIIGLWPLLAAAAVDVLGSYVTAARRSMTSAITAIGGLALMLGSLAMEAAVIVPMRIERARDNAEAARTVRATGDRVIVIDSIFDVEVVSSLQFERALMHVKPRLASRFGHAMAAQGVKRFTLVARPPGQRSEFPGYRPAEQWTGGRHVISRWVRDPSAAP